LAFEGEGGLSDKKPFSTIQEPNKQRFARSTGSVNQRLVSPVNDKPPPQRVHPGLRQRLERDALQGGLGKPLQRQLENSARPTAQRLRRRYVALGVGMTVVVVGGVLWGLPIWGWLVLLLLTGAASGLTWKARRQHIQHIQATVPAFFDPHAIAALDRVLTQIAPELDAPTLAQLRAIKATLVRMTPRLAQQTVSEVFTQEDHFYVTALVGRYLPDSLQAFLAVPSEVRKNTVGSSSAIMMLHNQLDLLQNGLSQREGLLNLTAKEALAQQARFLQAKHALNDLNPF
jgi:hypothetical protein